jgi:hypothetical protein
MKQHLHKIFKGKYGLSKWKSSDQAKRLASHFKKKKKTLIFATTGHVGMIKDGYTDPHFPYKETGDFWRVD